MLELNNQPLIYLLILCNHVNIIGDKHIKYLLSEPGFPWWLRQWSICLQCRDQDWSLGQEDILEKRRAAHSSILAWKIPWPEPGRSQSTGSRSRESYMPEWLTHAKLRKNMIECKKQTGLDVIACFYLCVPCDLGYIS